MAIVRRPGREDTTVWFEDDHWVCSECGHHTGKKVATTCVHVGAATRDLPLQTALSIMSRVADGSRFTTTKANSERDAARQSAEALARGAEARARRAADHDGSHVAASPLVVRQATPEDLQRLRLARDRKANAYEMPIQQPHI
jgi:hypothetical protein